MRLAYSTIDSYIGELRSIFSDIGCQGEWNRTFLIGNLASDLLVHQYLKEFTDGQLRVSIAPKQAVPLFADKLLLLSRLIEKRLLLSSLSPTEMFVTARNQAFSKALFFSGDRGGDVGQVKTFDIVCFPNNNNLIFILRKIHVNMIKCALHESKLSTLISYTK